LANRSTFPQQIDSFIELFDLPPNKVASAKRFQELKQKPTLNSTEQTELNALVVTLGNYIVTPETWNKFADSIVNLETFFTQEVMGFIEAKQVDWATYVNSFKFIGVYSVATSYKFQNMITYLGDLYLCKVNATGITPTNTTYWQKISTKGDKGDIGLNAHLKGNYNASATYIIGDALIYNGALYYCVQATTAGIAPTNSSYWFLWDKQYIGLVAPTTTQAGLMWIELLE